MPSLLTHSLPWCWQFICVHLLCVYLSLCVCVSVCLGISPTTSLLKIVTLVIRCSFDSELTVFQSAAVCTLVIRCSFDSELTVFQSALVQPADPCKQRPTASPLCLGPATACPRGYVHSTENSELHWWVCSSCTPQYNSMWKVWQWKKWCAYEEKWCVLSVWLTTSQCLQACIRGLGEACSLTQPPFKVSLTCCF